jgi:predicted ATPase
MRIERIGVDAFKCFQSVEIECGDITLLTGANSSGKSSLIYALLGTIQTAGFPFQYSPNGMFVNMGDFAEMAYKHSEVQPFEIRLKLLPDPQETLTFEASYSQNKETRLPELLKLGFDAKDFQCKVSRVGRKYKVKYKISQSSKSFPLIPLQRFVFEVVGHNNKDAKNEKNAQERRTLARMEKFFKPGKPSGTFTFENFIGLEKNQSRSFRLNQQLTTMRHVSQNLERHFNYIGAFRLSPERTYYQKTRTNLKVNQYGDGTFDQILQWENQSSKARDELNAGLRSLGIASEISIDTLAGGRYEVRVVPNGATFSSSLCDVGFGVSQFLPIIVADLQLSADSILAISQPEIHLHPSVQANMANYFNDRLKKVKRQYILETHSEYMLNRFRLLISEGKLKEEAVKVYFFETEAEGSKVYPITFRKNGQIDGAPKSFFETYMMDVMKIAMVAAE